MKRSVQTVCGLVERRGIDLNPLDPAQPADRLRLRAYLWPDQPHRRTLTDAAVAASGDAVDWLETPATLRHGHLHQICSTAAWQYWRYWQYLPPAAQARGAGLIDVAEVRATPDAPLAWFTMETDGTKGGALLLLRLWPGNETRRMGRADLHGRWIDWRPEG